MIRPEPKVGVRRRTLRTLALLLLWTCLPVSAQEPCPGDCDGDGAVTINEVIRGVNIGLDLLPLDSCPAFDVDGNGIVTVNELIAGVNAGLIGCSGSPPTPPPTATGGATATVAETPLPTATETAPPTVDSTETPLPTETPEPPLGDHICTLGPESVIEIYISAIPLPLAFNPTGVLSVDCGSVDAENVAVCSCQIEELNPESLPGVGVVCFAPGSGCAEHQIDCDGGDPLNIELVGDPISGDCDGNASCAASCDQACGAMEKTRFLSGCVGFCEGGDRDGDSCSRDSECPGGFCHGSDPVETPGTCQCQCVDEQVGAGGPPGEMQCRVGVAITVERAAPCDGTDVAFELGSVCLPATTGVASTLVANANGVPGLLLPTTGPAEVVGQAVTCAALSTGTEGQRIAGVANFLGSPLGDLAITFLFACD